MRKIGIYCVSLVVFMTLSLLSCGEKSNNKSKAMIMKVGAVVDTTPSTPRFENFFVDKDGHEFFPVGEWLYDFSYDSKKKCLQLTHINAMVNGDFSYNIGLVGDTIKISEFIFGNTVKSCTPTDVNYTLNEVKPKVYKLCVNNRTTECITLDLRNIEKENNSDEAKFSLMKDGSFLVSDEKTVATCEDIPEDRKEEM